MADTFGKGSCFPEPFPAGNDTLLRRASVRERRLDRESLAKLIRAHQVELWRYLRYLGADDGEADDLLQETFLAAWRSGRLTKIAQPRAQAAYLRGIVRNLFCAHCRRQGRRPRPVDARLLEQAEQVWTAEVRGGGADYLDALRQCVRLLHGRARDLIAMQYADGLSVAEIAARLGMAADGVKTLGRRTREALADCVRRRLARGENGQ